MKAESIDLVHTHTRHCINMCVNTTPPKVNELVCRDIGLTLTLQYTHILINSHTRLVTLPKQIASVTGFNCLFIVFFFPSWGECVNSNRAFAQDVRKQQTSTQLLKLLTNKYRAVFFLPRRIISLGPMDSSWRTYFQSGFLHASIHIICLQSLVKSHYESLHTAIYTHRSAGFVTILSFLTIFSVFARLSRIESTWEDHRVDTELNRI